MKAIVHVTKREPGLSDVRHNYRGHARRSPEEREFDGSRVFAIDGDTRGVGIIPREPGHERSLLDVLGGPHRYSAGRHLRQIILSAEDLTGASPEQFQAALATLMKAAKKWIDRFAPGCRWAAFAHQDRNHPHVHLIVENWDYRLDKRLNLHPELLADMQKMDWCKELGMVSGKGSLGRVKAGRKLAGDGVTLATATWQQRIELKAWEGFGVRKEAARELLAWCAKHSPPKSVEGLLEAMDQHPLPGSLVLMGTTKKGGTRRRPSVALASNPKVRLRLDSFLEVFAPNLSGGKASPDQTKPEGGPSL